MFLGAFRYVRRLQRERAARWHDEQLRKRCIAASSASLHATCKIDNFRGAADAIQVGEHCVVLGQLLAFAHGGQIHVGDYCFIGEHSRIWSASSVHIGDRVLVSHGVNIHDNDAHSLSAASRHEHIRQIYTTGHPEVLSDVATKPIVVEDDAWVGFNATILKGVTIGRGAVVAACAVVTHDVPPYAVVAGNPARQVGNARP